MDGSKYQIGNIVFGDIAPESKPEFYVTESKGPDVRKSLVPNIGLVTLMVVIKQKVSPYGPILFSFLFFFFNFFNFMRCKLFFSRYFILPNPTKYTCFISALPRE